MFSYTFWMLSQQFEESFIFIQSCCTFLLKAYIKPNQIWDTMSTSMELLAKISFSKFMLCLSSINFRKYIFSQVSRFLVIFARLNICGIFLDVKFTKINTRKTFLQLKFGGTEEWCKIWRKTDLCFQKWHEEFGNFSQAEK